MKKNKLFNIALIAVLVIGISLLSYPVVSNWWNTRIQTRAMTDYDAVVKQMENEQYKAAFSAADEYNAKIKRLPHPFVNWKDIDGYYDILDVTGTGLIGYITIDCINVKLPIYHGTTDEVLSNAVGHLEGSSFPVGGESTHAVLSAHRGLPSAELFTSLDRVKVGDIFKITVLNRTLIYQVDDIKIVDPDEIRSLKIAEGEDFCTLTTCTPYGINTQRLLVRGKRINNIPETDTIKTDAYDMDSVVAAPIIAVPLFVLFLVFVFIYYRSPKRKKNEEN